MNLITLDFETYFDSDYTLSKMTTEEYVRDPRFKTHCVGYKSDGAEGVSNCIDNTVARWINEAGIICHHAHFDGLILSHHYGIRPAFWFDTLSMARLVLPHLKSHSLGALAKHFGLAEKSVPYNLFKGVRDLPPDLYNQVAQGCKRDVELTYAIFQKLLPYVPQEELRVIDLTIRLFTEPALVLDVPRMQKYLDETQNAKEEVLEALGVTKADLQSSEKFAELLRARAVEVPMKMSPSDDTKKIYAFAQTDEAMKELEEDEDEVVQALVAARLGQKSTIGETRSRRLLQMAGRGPLCVYLKYAGAHTTRWSGGDKLNWQNFTRGGEIRKSILAPPGHQLVVIDLAQIECRMLNWLAGEESILGAFRSGRDLYSEGASRFYGKRVNKTDKVERHLGKILELGCGYGMGWEKFQVTCSKGALGGPPVSLDAVEAKAAVDSYRNSHEAVVKLWKHANYVLKTLHEGSTNLDFAWGPMQVVGKYIRLPNGAYLDYSNIIYRDREYMSVGRRGQLTKIYGAKLVENVVQALSRVVLSQAMLKVATKYKVALAVHDELVYVVPDAEASQALAWGLSIMNETPSWAQGLPVASEGSYAREYSK